MRDPKPRCSGHCCDLVALDYSAEVLLALWRRVPAIDLAALPPEQRDDAARGLEDARQVPTMLEFVAKGSTNPGTGETYPTPKNFYRCRHFQPETRSCGQYETRPPMCRAYPYGGNHCPVPGCTLAPPPPPAKEPNP